MQVPSYAVPDDVRVLAAERDRIAGVNNVYHCLGKRGSQEFRFFLKISKSSRSNMQNEKEVLEVLKGYGFPVPSVLWAGKARRYFMALEEMPGVILREFLSPHSDHYGGNSAYDALLEFGELVGRLHTLPISDWQIQRRTGLYGFLGEDEVDDAEFSEIVGWLNRNPPPEKDIVFVHGDLNDANVLVERRRITAILDWESAGLGWREYDLAWVLRERRNYMNTDRARRSFLDGYASKASYDPVALRWCEVINCLHVAMWCRERYPNYMEFNLQKAREAMHRDPDW